MWILKNSNEFYTVYHVHVTSIKSFDFATLYTTIPYQELKNRLASIIRNSLIFKTVTIDTNIWYFARKAYFVKKHFD